MIRNKTSKYAKSKNYKFCSCSSIENEANINFFFLILVLNIKYILKLNISPLIFSNNVL